MVTALTISLRITVTVDRGRCADQLARRRGYARPAVGSRPRSRENMVAVNADALVRPARAVLPAISPEPLRYRLPLCSPSTATGGRGSPLSQGPMHSIWLARNGFTPSLVDDLYCPR